MSDLIPPHLLSWLQDYDCLWVGLSGGVDSVVLAHLLLQQPLLRRKVNLIHVNHNLQPEAAEWEKFCLQIAHDWQVPIQCDHVVVKNHGNLEHNARQARYQQFQQYVCEHDALLTAHHLDDQIETFFLNLCRGAGLAGLAAMPAIQALEKGWHCRPLLSVRRAAILAYAQQHQLTYCNDPSNQNLAFNRNWLRHHWLPQLMARMPHAADNIYNSIGLIQQHLAQQDNQAQQQLDECLSKSDTLLMMPLLQLTKHDQHLVFRQWLKINHLPMPTQSQLNQLVQTVLLAKPDATPCWQYQGHVVRRYQDKLILMPQRALHAPAAAIAWSDFPNPLTIQALEMRLTVKLKTAKLPQEPVSVVFRQGGECVRWRGHRRTLKAIFQENRIPPWQRPLLPIIKIGTDIVTVGDWLIADDWQDLIDSVVISPI